MNKTLKYSLISVGAILVAFLALIALVAATFNPNDYKPLIVKLVQDKKQRTLKLEGDIKLTFFPRIGADLGKLSLSEHGSDKEFAAVDSVRVSLAVLPLLKKQLVVDHVRVDGIRARLVRYPDGSTSIDDLLKQEEEKSEQFKFDIEGVSVTRAALAFDDRMGGRKLEISGLEFESGRLANKQPGKVDIKFALQGDNPKIDVQVALVSGLLFDTEAKAVALDKLVASLNFSGPAMPRALDINLGGAVRLDLARQDAHLDLAGKVDDSPLKVKLGISRFDAPAYDFDIAIEQLDVDRYLTPPKSEAKQPEKPLDFGFLKNLNASGQLNIGALKVANIKSSNIKLNVRADGGNLHIAPISANFYQGTLNGAISLHGAGTPRVALKQNLAGVSVGPLLKDAANVDMLEGRGSVTLDVSAQGATVSAMKKAMQGSAALNLRDGALKGINIAGAIRSAKARLGSSQGESTQAANAADQTDFSELTASFQINNGVAHNEDLSAKSPLLRLAGNGDVNIGEGAMNYLAKATVVASLEGQGGKELSALKGVTVPVRITGPFAALKYSLDFNAMASEAVKQKVEQKKEEVKARLGEELKGGLKGLW